MDKNQIVEQIYTHLHDEFLVNPRENDDEKLRLFTSTQLDMKHWPIKYHDVLTMDSISVNTSEGTAKIHNEMETDETVELRQRNATGGDYIDVKQEIFIDGEISFDINEDEKIVEITIKRIDGDCNIKTSNSRSYSGETPPF